MSAQIQKIRRIVWTGAIASVTMTGVWYGAGLKTQAETKQMIQKRREATTDEKLAQLEKQRSALVAKKFSLEKKLNELEAKMTEKARKAEEDARS